MLGAGIFLGSREPSMKTVCSADYSVGESVAATTTSFPLSVTHHSLAPVNTAPLPPFRRCSAAVCYAMSLSKCYYTRVPTTRQHYYAFVLLSDAHIIAFGRRLVALLPTG
ncbi:hypothetical protein PsYK624_149790 [Phanerochaete sordida]|uniref:Uncharacterized protein n=1 Tax=Phanerochaete sordida TaxID=48140 RepID=A0A9P3LKM2_9APHY|nr:hypothetical protein PsYK624_149790 [Phanerochaete sordida]